MAVVAFHLSMAFADPRYGGQGIGERYTSQGRLGVDFFFVLSGFIILQAHRADFGNAARLPLYLWRRFARVYPIYWIYRSAMCVRLVLGLGQVAKAPEDGISWLTDFSLIRFSTHTPPLKVAWTLFHEVAFYAVFSLLLVNRRLGIVAMALWATACIVNTALGSPAAAQPWGTYVSAYNLEFFFGMCAYAFSLRKLNAWLVSGTGFVLVAAGQWLIGQTGISEQIIFGAAFSLIIAGAASAERHGRLKLPQLFVAIGDSSYSLYLIHLPVIGLLLKLVGYANLGAVVPPALLWWSVFAVTVGIGYGAWILIESPMQRALRPPREGEGGRSWLRFLDRSRAPASRRSVRPPVRR